MPLSSVVGAGILGSGASSIWNYNRANYMFDVPLKQNREFQIQNVQLARYGLFREDVRDMAVLTSDKAQTYLVTNTLQLGFIITILFNFDRNNSGDKEPSFEVEMLSVLFSASMLTAFFWLITSIWLSTHALILSDSLMTKMLVQVVRLPLPTVSEIGTTVPNAEAFERNFSRAFRVPFIGRGSREEETSQASAPQGPEQSYLLNKGGGPSRDTDSSRGEPSLPELTGSISIVDLAQGRGIPAEVADSIRSAVDPHVKFFKLVRASWSRWDLYSKVSMEIGTVCLLSGLSYFAVTYLRIEDAMLKVEPQGFVAFTCMSLTAYYVLTMSLELAVWEYFVAAALVMGGQALFTAVYYVSDQAHDDGTNKHDAMNFAIAGCMLLQATWILLVCWSALFPWKKWPTRWRYSRFLNILHEESGPAPSLPDISRNKAGTGQSVEDLLDDGFSSGEDVDTLSAVGSDEHSFQLPPHARQGAYLSAGPLLTCLDILLDLVQPKSKSSREIRQVRDKLDEAARAAGATDTGAQVMRLVQGFSVDRRWWVNPSGREDVDREDADELSLREILDVSLRTATTLSDDSQIWTAEDMERLAEYGGESVPGVRSFVAQFQSRGSGAPYSMGARARRSFLASVLVVSAFWMSVITYGFSLAWTQDGFPGFQEDELPQNSSSAAAPAPARLLGSRLAFELPSPWLAPVSLGCDGDGERLVVADGVGNVFLGYRNGSDWQGPFSACDGAGVAGADFGPRGELWAACALGLRRVPLSADIAAERPDRSSAAVVAGMEAVALDAAPPQQLRGGHSAQGLALLRGQLVALSQHGDLGWKMAGAVIAPAGHRWAAVSMRGGRGLALDDHGAAFEWDGASGRWAERPAELPERRSWRGLCLLPDGAWLALGQLEGGLGAGAAGPSELWHFSTRHELPEL